MDSLQLPIPIYQSHRIGSVTSKDGKEFSVMIGLDKDLVAELKHKSLDMSDTDLQKNTSDYKRFGEGSYEEWYGKDRTPYALIDEKGALAALAWFGPKPLGRKSLKYLSEEELAQENMQEKGDWHTIVYRSYAPFRGIGVMTPFMRLVIDEYKNHFPSAKLWAGISTDNPASIALAKKFGFKELPEYADENAHWCAFIEA